jgi:alcohol dehydrogenase
LFTVAVPTTSGTGSEVTPYSVITDPAKKAKPAISYPQNFPDYAVVDPQLTMTMPTEIAVSTGLDALTQAMEGFWSTRGNDISRSMAFKAIVLAYRHLEHACLDKDATAVEALAAASNICGIQMAMVGNTAIHPLSYPLTIDHGVKHGFACALFLPEFLRFNAPVLHGGFADLFAVLGLKSAADLAEDLTAKMEKLGAPTRLAPLGVALDDIADIARRGVGRSTEWNPRKVQQDDIIAICQRVF